MRHAIQRNSSETCFPGSLGLSNAVLALGEPDFGARLFGCLCDGMAIDMYSAFIIKDGTSLQLAFAGATCRTRDRFAVSASERYAETFWQSDPLLRVMLSNSPSASAPKTQSWRSIPRGEYREYCYERPGVVDRMSIYQQLDGTGAVLNLYRYKKNGHFSDAEVDGLRHWVGILPALIVKHVRMQGEKGRSALHPPLDALSERIRSLNTKLSSREGQVCAAILIGMPAKEISRRVGVEVSTIVTYKKRAYEKLGVNSKEELRSYYQRYAVN
jgi:LuxR family transcriptional regulator, activator of tox operons